MMIKSNKEKAAASEFQYAGTADHLTLLLLVGYWLLLILSLLLLLLSSLSLLLLLLFLLFLLLNLLPCINTDQNFRDKHSCNVA